MSLQVPPRCIFVSLTHIPLFLALVNLIPFTSAVSCHVFFLPVPAKRPSYNNMYAKVFHKIIFSFKMLMYINCNKNVKYTSLNSCPVCHLQNHCLKCWFCKNHSFLVEEEMLMVWRKQNDTNKNWDKDCSVTDGGENNVFNSKPK